VSVQAAAPETSFGARAARGTFWTGLRYVAENALRLGSNLILTRLLFPEAYGLMTLVTTLIVGLGLFSDFGLSTSVVQSPRGDDPRFLRTVWTLQVLRGVLLWAVASALAWPAAAFYGSEQLRTLIPCAALTAALTGLNSMSMSLMQRHLQLGRLAGIELATQVITTGATLCWALLDPSVWALIGGSLIGFGARVVMSYALAPGAPFGFAWDAESLRQLLRFGVWIYISTALFFVTTQADRLIFGRLLSVETLGIYGLALALAGIPSQLLWSIGNFVLLPTFSRQLQAGRALDVAYRRMQLPVLVLGALAVAGLLACGPELIDVLYDDRYLDAGWMLQLVAVGAWFQIPQALSANALLASGAPQWMVTANAMKLGGMVLLVPAGYLLFGAPGAIGGVAAAEAFRWGSLALAVRLRGISGAKADVGCTLLVGAASLAGWLAADALGREGFTVLPRLCAGVGALLAVWIPVAAWLLRADLQLAWARVARR
jgi:O-antigen/teichoic acid export membrane protein